MQLGASFFFYYYSVNVWYEMVCSAATATGGRWRVMVLQSLWSDLRLLQNSCDCRVSLCTVLRAVLGGRTKVEAHGCGGKLARELRWRRDEDLVSMICVKIEQCVCIAFIYCAPQSAELMPSRCRLDRIGYTSGEGTYHHTVLLQ